eukprot:COSAG01_NODE_14840_length_1404_cov_0.938697_2_plen_29_part_01
MHENSVSFLVACSEAAEIVLSGEHVLTLV